MKIYLICPVRDSKRDFSSIVAQLEADGHSVHFPPRDVNQNDATGFNICKSHFIAMLAADTVYIIWDVNSKGSHFDLGMAFALNKPVKLIESLYDDTSGKSYLKVIQEMETRDGVY